MAAPEAYTSPGFWQRPFAMMIDLVIIAVLGQVIILFFYSFLKFHLILSNLIGILLSIGYFAVTDSHLTQGMSAGKKLLRIRLLNQSGQFLKPWQAGMRSILPMTPIWLVGIPSFGSEPVYSWVVFLGFSLVLVQWGLYLIDRPARMMLQDRFFKATVTREHEEGLPQSTLAAKQVIIIVSFVLVSLLALRQVIPAKQDAIHPFTPLQQELLSRPDIMDVRIRQGIVGRNDHEYRLSIALWMTRGPEISAAELAEISNAAYRLYPDLSTLDGLHLVIKSGVDLAITDSFSHKIYFVDND